MLQVRVDKAHVLITVIDNSQIYYWIKVITKFSTICCKISMSDLGSFTYTFSLSSLAS